MLFKTQKILFLHFILIPVLITELYLLTLAKLNGMT